MEDPMAHELSNDELKRLARLGAVARLEQLEAERQAILRAFPGLRGPVRQEAAAHAGHGGPAPATPKIKTRKRRPMSAEQKRAASERMTKYWAARKQG
jgi:hypothetical protein